MATNASLVISSSQTSMWYRLARMSKYSLSKDASASAVDWTQSVLVLILVVMTFPPTPEAGLVTDRHGPVVRNVEAAGPLITAFRRPRTSCLIQAKELIQL